jgi:hypothetical protein
MHTDATDECGDCGCECGYHYELRCNCGCPYCGCDPEED